MSKTEPGLFYTHDDEWVRVDGDEAEIGISDFAQEALSDIVYLELPSVGDSFTQGGAFGVVESVKAAADLLMPVDGEIIAVNDELTDSPEQLNNTPYEAWLVRIKMSRPDQVASLMDATAYAAHQEANS